MTDYHRHQAKHAAEIARIRTAAAAADAAALKWLRKPPTMAPSPTNQQQHRKQRNA